MSELESLKECNVCLVKKPLTEFYFRKERGVYRKNCKKCKPLVSKEELIKKAHSETKVCKHCHIEKHRSEYQKACGGKYTQPYCKVCDSIRKKKYEKDNEEDVKKKKKIRYFSTRVLVSPERKIESRIKCNEVIVKAAKEYREKMKMTPEQLKARKSENAKRFREKHKEKIREKKREYMKRVGNKKKSEWQKRMMDDIEFRLTKNLRSRIYVALKRGIKSDTTMNLIGCSIDYFKSYIEKQFTNGMNWQNMGFTGWHLDHKIPCDSFDLTNHEEQKKCFHYSNIQPLWRIDNLKKGSKVNYKIDCKNGN